MGHFLAASMVEQGQTRDCPPQFGTALKTKESRPEERLSIQHEKIQVWPCGVNPSG
jgi:hypothetical protein